MYVDVCHLWLKELIVLTTLFLSLMSSRALGPWLAHDTKKMTPQQDHEVQKAQMHNKLISTIMIYFVP